MTGPMTGELTTELGGQHTFCSQGWQCPICHRVYSPWTSMCFYCGQPESITYTTTTDPITDKGWGEKVVYYKGDK